MRRYLTATLITAGWWGAWLVPLSGAAQGTLQDYRRAAAIGDRLRGLTMDVADAPTWIDGTNQFWYRKTVPGGSEFVLVDAATQEKRPAFDHERLAGALAAAGADSTTAVALPFTRFEYADDMEVVVFTVAGGNWRCSLATWACTRTPATAGGAVTGGFGGRGGGPGAGGGQPANAAARVSPDGRWEAFIQNYNIAIRPANAAGRGAGAQANTAPPDYTVLSRDGSEGNAYQLNSIRWSPDSRTIAVYRQRPGYRRMVYYVLSSPADQLQPKLDSLFYRKPGDVLDFNQLVLFDVEAGTQFDIDNRLFPNAYQISTPEWRPDSRRLTFEYNQRGHQVYRVLEVDAATGAVRAIISEEVPTFFNYRTANGNRTDSGKKFRYDVGDGREIIWASERDGWNHLYMYDGVTGRVKHQITKGEWVVRAVDRVDEQNRHIYFRAGGMNPDHDPVFIHYYRIDFDGTGLVAYTEADGNHAVYWSPTNEYYVDMYSRVDMPTVMELRRTSDRRVLAQLEKGDMSAQLATGWRPPEVFVAKGRDGVTDIWGIIVRPTTFDANRRYPVIENIYAGPHGSHTPKDWSPVPAMQSLAELGFIVVQMDGMGTSNRSKAFHDVAWQNLADAGFPDRILWHRAVAARYPHYDIDRMGITGGSAGGQNATGALLFHGDFYKVAVVRNGCHDNRMDKIWWNEHWMGWPLGPHYEASSNVTHAHRLRGKLLLAVGEHDTNVDPSSSMQLVNALIQSGRYFDVYFEPNGNHGLNGNNGQLIQRRNDYFVKHLLSVEPPDWNVVSLGFDATGRPLRLGAAELEPPPGFFEHGDDAPPFSWW